MVTINTEYHCAGEGQPLDIRGHYKPPPVYSSFPSGIRSPPDCPVLYSLCRRFKIMKRTYRGIPYEVDASEVKMVDSQLRGQYRGAVFNYRQPVAVPVPQPVLSLCYRGVEYRNDGRSIAVVPMPQVTPTLQPTSTAFQLRQQQLQDLEMIHRANIRRTVEQRLASAREKGNDKLVQMLEAELQQFA